MFNISCDLATRNNILHLPVSNNFGSTKLVPVSKSSWDRHLWFFHTQVRWGARVPNVIWSLYCICILLYLFAIYHKNVITSLLKTVLIKITMSIMKNICLGFENAWRRSKVKILNKSLGYKKWNQVLPLWRSLCLPPCRQHHQSYDYRGSRIHHHKLRVY